MAPLTEQTTEEFGHANDKQLAAMLITAISQADESAMAFYDETDHVAADFWLTIPDAAKMVKSLVVAASDLVKQELARELGMRPPGSIVVTLDGGRPHPVWTADESIAHACPARRSRPSAGAAGRSTGRPSRIPPRRGPSDGLPGGHAHDTRGARGRDQDDVPGAGRDRAGARSGDAGPRRHPDAPDEAAKCARPPLSAVQGSEQSRH